MAYPFTATAANNNSGNSPPGSAAWSGAGGGATCNLQVSTGMPALASSNWCEFSGFATLPIYVPTVPSAATAVVVNIRIRCKDSVAAGVMSDAGIYLLDNGGSAVGGDQSSGTPWASSYTDRDYAFPTTAAVVNAGGLVARIAATLTGADTTLGMCDVESVKHLSTDYTIPSVCGGAPASGDDGYGTDAGTYDAVGLFMRTGKTGGNKYAVFTLLSNLVFDTDDTVTAAYVWAYDRGGAAIDVKIGVKNSVSPTAPANASAAWTDVNSNLTATQVAWSISSSSPTSNYPIIQSSDIAAVMTEYFAIGGFTTGASDLLLYVYGETGTTDVHDFGTQDGGEALYLTVEFSSGVSYTLGTGNSFMMFFGV